MFIKAVNIQGFKSYREQLSVEDFSPRHNVIVGRNGSGKSNFFFAIQFVLSDEFTNMRMEQRQALLHEGTGPRVITAKVEIVFDNTDQRIPIERDEVRLVRQIGAKKDQYLLEGKTITRTDVQNLMESTGFSRSNPYYIVKQGKINELATARDEVRLKLLKEVAGTRVYDERKEESQRTMEETENKREKIENLLNYIEERLTTLEAEKEELKEYQKWDRVKRSVEYTIIDAEQREMRQKELKLQSQRENIAAEKDELMSKQTTIAGELNRVKRQRRELEARFAGMKDEREQLAQDKTALFQEKTKIDLRASDLRTEQKTAIDAREAAEEELKRLKAEIADKKEKRDDIAPRLTELQEREAEIDTQMKILDARRQELYMKQGAGDRFTSKEERDKHLHTEIRGLERQIATERDNMNGLKREVEAEKEEHERLRNEIGEHSQSVDGRRHNLEAKNNEKLELTKRREKLVDERKEMWREEQTLQAQKANLDDERVTIDGQLRASAGKAAAAGMASVRKVLASMAERGGSHRDIVDGYRGTLIANLRTAAEYHRAVDTIGGPRLFYHIVDTDRVSTRILEEMNKQKLPGEVTCFALNRVQTQRDIVYPQSEHAVPMTSVLEYDNMLEPVVRSVFGKAMICRSMAVCSDFAKQHKLDCVTMEGDIVTGRGMITGGYVDTTRRRGRLELQTALDDVDDRRRQLRGRQDELTRRLNELEAQLNIVEKDIVKREAEAMAAKEEFAQMQQHNRQANERLQTIAANQRVKEQQLRQQDSWIKQLQAKRDDKKAELGADMHSQLTADEQTQLETIVTDVANLRKEYEKVSAERRQLDEEKSHLDNALEMSLYPRRDELNTKTMDVSIDERQHEITQLRAALETLQQKIKEATEKLGAFDEDMQEYTTDRDRLQEEENKAAEEDKANTAQLQECSKQQELIATKNTAIFRKREELKKRFQEIGTLPADALDKYSNLSTKQLEKKLMQCNQELKKYENVNKKALDQFVSFSEQKDKLTLRQTELQRAYDSINELMGTLDQRKTEAIHITFKQVSRNFEEIFTQLVPTGSGRLVMRTEAAGLPDDEDTTMDGPSDEDEDDPDAPPRERRKRDKERKARAAVVENFTGVGIRVSFTGTSDMREMQQLSGGQKTLVALALIFAIQKCDPAPFYLFDEIDAALDAQHRKAVADMIHKQADRAQFITTTFRPELLEHADKFYGVLFRGKVSHVKDVDSTEAYEFVENDQTHA